jgi:hypothetical protein
VVTLGGRARKKKFPVHFARWAKRMTCIRGHGKNDRAVNGDRLERQAAPHDKRAVPREVGVWDERVEPVVGAGEIENAGAQLALVSQKAIASRDVELPEVFAG